MKKQLKLVALGGMLLLASGYSFAQSSDSGKGWTFDLGVFLTDWDTDASLNGSGSTGTPIDFESELALSSSINVFRLDTEYRFSQKHRINFTYFDIERNGTAVTTMNIMWGDQNFPVGTTVSTSFDITFYQLSYTYGFLVREDWYLGALVGLHIMDIDISLNAPSIAMGQTGSVTAPLPVIGLRGQYDFNDKWTARGNIQAFAIELDNISGSMIDSSVAVDYQLFKKAALGLAYNAVTINVDAGGTSYNGSLDWDYRGPVAYFKVDF